ncbi:MAG TPA: sodium:proton exchanger [Candidatus Marinimicrobia bacterium]|nr:sodium:proton exchanger [Candidatus Neomarinimicrobiota bacterium]
MKTIKSKFPVVPKLFIFMLLVTGITFANSSNFTEFNMTHRMMMLVIQLGVILFAARLGNIIFDQIHLPGVLGELTAGIIIGPYLVGAISIPGFPNGLFPVFTEQFPISPELYGVCTLASIVLLFMIGLETDIKLFIRYSAVGSLVGISGVLVSFFVGDFLTIVFSKMLFGVSLGFFSPSCLFLGIVATATSVGITARILSEQNKLDSPEGVTILAGAVIDDVLGIILLAVGLGIISASKVSGNVDWRHIGVIAAKAIGIWLTATIIGLLTSRKIGVLLKWFKDRSSISMMALGFALILSGLFEEAGLAMIIGAYVMGLSLSKTDINRVIMEKLNPIYSFLVPIFFTVMGMLVNIKLLSSKNVLIFGFVYTLGAVAAKIIGCGTPTLFNNFNLRGALRIGFGMLPRGEVALIIAGIGLSAGLLPPEIFGVTILMTLVTTLIAPPVLVALFRQDVSGVRKPLAEEKSPRLIFSFPSVETSNLMIDKLFSVFESEGFFIYTLSQSQKIYQLRKDEMIIGVQNKGSEVEFDCSKSEAPYINTAMYEVLAEFESTVKELRKPIDVEAIAKRLQAQTTGVGLKSNLSAYISKDTLRPHLKGNSKNEIIDELLDLMNQRGLINDFKAARRAVYNREESMSTGIQFGIAIPHGRTDAVQKLVCAIGLKPEGVDFNSIDGKPSQIFVLTLSPETASAPHMQFMSMISQALDENGRKALLECKTARQMYEVLTKSRQPGKGKFSIIKQ